MSRHRKSKGEAQCASGILPGPHHTRLETCRRQRSIEVLTRWTSSDRIDCQDIDCRQGAPFEREKSTSEDVCLSEHARYVPATPLCAPLLVLIGDDTVGLLGAYGEDIMF